MEPPGTIAGLGARTDTLSAVPLGAAARRRLSGEEVLVLAMVGRASTIQEILGRSELPEAKTIQILLGLRAKGAIAPAGGSGAPAAAPAAPAAAPSEPPPPPVRPSGEEAVELPPERREEILALERKLDAGADHYQVLGVAPGAGGEELRRAYHEASRRFHPDRYFSRNLGSFRARVERIFRRVNEAHDVLSDPERRGAYLQAHPELAGAGAGPGQGEDPVRAAERKQRLSRHPYLARSRQVHELVAEGKHLLEQGQPSRAVSQLTLAVRAEPQNRELQALLQEARRRNELDRSRQELDRAAQLELAGEVAAAAAQYRAASTLDPRSAVAAAKAAAAMLRAGEDLKEAKVYAQRAVDLQPRDAGWRVLLARILLGGDLKKLARRELEEALRCHPGHAEAQALLKKVKWPF